MVSAQTCGVEATLAVLNLRVFKWHGNISLKDMQLLLW